MSAGFQGYTWKFIKNESLAQVFSCEVCKIPKNISGGLLLCLTRVTPDLDHNQRQRHLQFFLLNNEANAHIGIL